MNTNYSPQQVARQRWDVIDVARGIAICAMVIYHFSWDLSFLKLIATNIIQDAGWRWFARCIAGSFLFLAGIGLTLAHAKGFDRTGFLKRLLRIGGSAALITVATYFAFPESFIFFGILHCIAVSSVLALPFLRFPAAVSAVTAILFFAAPFIFTSPALDAPWLDWLGLGLLQPNTNDYVPIFPWFGIVLIGIVCGKALLVWRGSLGLSHWRAGSPFSRILIWLGRKSLPIYLLHQVVLLGALWGVLQITGPNPVAEARPFVQQCEASCLQTGSSERICKATCGCIADRLRQDGQLQAVLTGSGGPDMQMRVSRLAQQCLRSTPP